MNEKFLWQSWCNFMKMPVYLAALGTDRYKELLTMTALPAVNAMAELAAKTEKSCKNQGPHFVKYTPHWTGKRLGNECYPMTDEVKAEFKNVGTVMGDKDVYLRQGKLYVVEDRHGLPSAGYYPAASASWTLRMMSHGLTYLANTMMFTSNMLWSIYGQEPKKP